MQATARHGRELSRFGPCLDDAAVAELCDAIGAERATRMFVQYLADAAVQVAAISEACKLRDIETLRTRAHTLKGTSANLGVAACRDHAAAIVQACLDKDSHRAFDLASGIAETFEVAQATIVSRFPAAAADRQG